MTLSYTPNFRFGIPDFDTSPWHDDFEALVRAIDTAIHDALLSNAEDWANSTAYAVGDIVLDTVAGSIWVCQVAHTSPASPTTFLTFRTANPTYWNTTANIPQQRGTWTTATSYIPGDFVVDTNRYAVCVVGHVSGVFNTDLGTGKWVVLIDLSNISVGINNIVEDTIASAATTNIGSKTATRLSVTGAVGITSFGNTANTFKILRFTSTPAVTHNATTLILLGGANRTMRAGDIMWVQSDAAFNWREIAFFRADGNPATATERGVVELATTAEAAAGTDVDRAVTPAGAFFGYLPGPSGTKSIFFQAAAPTGWTKDTTHNDKAIRIVTGTGGGSGGSSAFTTVFGKTATDSHTSTLAESASHDHGGATGNDSPVHTHSYLQPGGTAFQAVSSPGSAVPGSSTQQTGNPSVNHTHSITSAGGGGGHTHPMDIRVTYIDCLVCTKN